jgi:DNA-binding LacI/PurR family transcriptional regulator
VARRVTLADVADRAGTSKSVVSAVVNGRAPGVIRFSTDTRDRVWSAARQLGYVANPIARRLAGGRTQLLGVFTYLTVFPLDADDFYHPFLTGVEEAAASRDFDLLLFTRSDAGRRTIYRGGANSLQLADGAVLFGSDEDRAELTRLVTEQYPFVYIGHRDIAGMSYVAGDYAGGTRAVIGEIAAHGHRKISYLRGSHDLEIAADREQGYLDGLRAAGDLEPLIRRVDTDRDLAAAFLAELRRGVTAVVTEGSERAGQIRRIGADAGLRCPEDYSLAGLSGRVYDPDTGPGLTTFAIPRHEMGVAAVDALCELLADPGREPIRLTLPCPLRRGTTVGPPAGLGASERPGTPT